MKKPKKAGTRFQKYRALGKRVRARVRSDYELLGYSKQDMHRFTRSQFRDEALKSFFEDWIEREGIKDEKILDIIKNGFRNPRVTAGKSYDAPLNDLAELKDYRTLPVFNLFLNGSHGGNRVSAAYGLGILGDKRAIPLLRRRLAVDKLLRVRKACLSSLVLLNDRGSIPLLIDVLKHEKEDSLRANAVRGLDFFGGREAEAALLQELKKVTVKTDAGLTGALFEVASERKLKEAVTPLIGFLISREQNVLKSQAAYALGEIGDLRALKPLFGVYNDCKRITHSFKGAVLDATARETLDAMAKISKAEAVKRGASERGWGIVYNLMENLSPEISAVVLLSAARDPRLRRNIPRTRKDRERIEFYRNLKAGLEGKNAKEVMDTLKFKELYKEELHYRI